MDDGGARAIRPGEFLLVEEDPALEDGGGYLVETPEGCTSGRPGGRGRGFLCRGMRGTPRSPSRSSGSWGAVRGVVQYEPLT
jgi:hypothetical protein